MDPKNIEMVDQVVNGYNKVRSLYKENEEVFKKFKTWFQEHKTAIIITVIILAGLGIYFYRQFQETKAELAEQPKSNKKEASAESSARSDDTKE